MGNGCIKAKNNLNENTIQIKKEPINNVYKRNVCMHNSFLFDCDGGSTGSGADYYHRLYFRYNSPHQFLPRHKHNKRYL